MLRQHEQDVHPMKDREQIEEFDSPPNRERQRGATTRSHASIGQVWSQFSQGQRLVRRGKWEAAVPLLQQALDGFAAAHEQVLVVKTLYTMGSCSLRSGNIVEAATRFSEAFAQGRKLNDGTLLGYCLIGTGVNA